MHVKNGEPLWLSGKVVKNEKINEIERTRVRSPPPPGNLLKRIHVKNVVDCTHTFNAAFQHICTMKHNNLPAPENA
jgi:hypothetical protein